MKHRNQYLCLTIIALILVGTLMPGHIKAEIEERFWDVIPWSNLAHFLLFAALAALPIYGVGWRGAVRAFALAFGLACITEIIQNWVPDRHSRLLDVGIDMAGATVGYVVSWAWGRRTWGGSDGYPS